LLWGLFCSGEWKFCSGEAMLLWGDDLGSGNFALGRQCCSGEWQCCSGECQMLWGGNLALGLILLWGEVALG